ncbi:MAG: hypothetical protein K1060chlam5_01350, partial [Candidatus Anoxychlamydiales bacterium]|nr:hypothetical protein [Candidatus Anoxychlamydiales bacterium]
TLPAYFFYILQVNYKTKNLRNVSSLGFFLLFFVMTLLRSFTKFIMFVNAEILSFDGNIKVFNFLRI